MQINLKSRKENYMKLVTKALSAITLAALTGSLGAQSFSFSASNPTPNIQDPTGTELGSPSFGVATVNGISTATFNGQPVLVSAYLNVLDTGGMVNGDYYAWVTHNGATAILLNRVGRTQAPGSYSYNPQYGYPDSGFQVTLKDGNQNIHTYQDIVKPAAGTPITGTWGPDGRTSGGVGGNGLTEVVDANPANFSVFNGMDMNGDWTFGIVDCSAGGQGQVTSWGVTFVPEPHQYAMVAGLGLLGFAIYRRRQAK